MHSALKVLLPFSLLLMTSVSALPAASSRCADFLLLADSSYSTDRDGERGYDGREGRIGQGGDDRTIVTNGNSFNLDLSGRDGQDGEDGASGRSPTCYSTPYNVDRTVYAPNGGDGGRGGRGGDGGDGGSLTVYYTNPADLQRIYVRSQGGQAGRGGRGGYGGQGCQCTRRSWEIKTCKGTPGSSDYQCSTQRYRCHDGRDGSRGYDGPDGRLGSLGRLTLIRQKEPLLPDRPTLQVSLSEVQTRSVGLSLNRWKTLRGAAALLAPGSIVADEYREFVERVEGAFQLVWSTRRSAADFANQPVTLVLGEDRQVRVSFPEEIWVEGVPSTQNGLTRYTVTNLVRQSEVTQLKVADFSGRDDSLSFALVDLAGKSDIIQTEFQLTYRAASRSAVGRERFGQPSDYQVGYSGKIPAELVTRDYNRFSLALGKLPIPPDLREPGTVVDLELTITRSFAGRSKTQSLAWSGEIAR
ncbi:hypothetical protein BST81_11375 [Leptolyngbya sp. 'hensonii']|uniref:hypothetical protein n=1 Tax=Leptolyngbya sp. 'hensonii' TaxID=1922337 RepID=UPI00094FEDCB|nr:hypothetical protein [Leptolyngbya sp. 'hensonii']OLP18317.1 hypothetical protein BST81_11375 [Leptolyngbya sp. 'hensonii']